MKAREWYIVQLQYMNFTSRIQCILLDICTTWQTHYVPHWVWKDISAEKPCQLTRTTERVVTEMNRFAPTNNTLLHMSHTLYQRQARSSFKPCVRALENWIIFCRKEKQWNSSLINKNNTHNQQQLYRWSVYDIEGVEWQSYHQGNDQHTSHNQHYHKRVRVATQSALIKEDLSMFGEQHTWSCDSERSPRHSQCLHQHGCS